MARRVATFSLRCSCASPAIHKKINATVVGQNLKPMLVPFVDAGRVFDKVGQFSLNDWKATGGLGLRIAWNLATIISFEYGVGNEGSLFYMEIGHQF